MDRAQLPRSVRHWALRQAMIASNPRLTSPRCAHVSTSLFDARNVAPFARQSQSFRQKLSSLARDVNRNAPLSCSVPEPRQDPFRFIRFTALSPRGGIRTSTANLTLLEGITRNAINCVARYGVVADNSLL